MRLWALILAGVAAYAALPASDSFVAANGTALTTYSANWTANKNTFTIQSNSVQCGTGGDYCFATWNADSFPNDQYAQITLTATSAGNYSGVAVRASGTAGTYAAYACIAESGTVQIQRYASGAFAANLGAPYSATIFPGDVIRFEVVGTSLTCKVNGVSRTTATDATLATGSAGIAAFSNGATRGSTWSAGSMATGPTISAVTVNDITAYQARVSWTTSTSSTSAKIKTGTSDPPTTVFTILNDSAATEHVGFASGLTPGTLTYYQVCSTDGSGETCTTSSTFTTLSATPGVAVPPVAPTAFNPAYPSSFTSTDTVASNCSDLQAKINTASSLNGNNNYEIVIPASTLCVGRYTLPTKTGTNPTGTGYIVIRGGNTSPPFGAQTSSAYAMSNPEIMGNYLWAYYQTSDPSSCTAGDILLRSDTLSIKYCTSANTWTAQSVTTGAGAPSTTCTAGAWYRDTAIGDSHAAFYWCTETNVNVNMYIDSSNNFSNWAAISTTGATAKGYWVTGVTVENTARPSNYTSLLSTSSGSGDEIGSFSRCMVSLQGTDSNMVFDRIYFQGRGYPQREDRAFCFFKGSNIASIGNYFNNINRWRPTTAPETSSNAIMIEDGPGPALIKNNYFLNTTGMSIFHNDEFTGGLGEMDDVSILNNTFYISPSLDINDSSTNGKLYYFRHHIEMKRGKRWLIKGNYFSGGWPGGNPSGASIGITPTVGSGMSTANCKTNQIATRDINIESNKFLYAPQVFLMTGRTVYGGASCMTAWGGRYAVTNNVIYTTGQTETGGTNGTGGLQLNGQVANIGYAIQDITINNNITVNPTSACCSANIWSFAGEWNTWPNSNFIFQNNIYYGTTIPGFWGIWNGGTNQGTAALNTVIVPNNSYNLNGNAFMKGWTGFVEDTSTYPGTNYRDWTAANFTPYFYRYSIAGDESAFRPLVSSKFAAGSATARGYNGDDNGPDWVAFDQAQGNIRNQRVLSISSSGATVYWTAPDDTTVATIEYGTSSTPGTGTRVTDTPTSRFRSKALTGLSSGTLYYVRIYQGGMVSTSFTTQ